MDSHIKVLSVTSDYAIDQVFLNGRVQQGGIYFNDCLTFVNVNVLAATHLQVNFALVDENGAIKRTPMPYDTHDRAEPGAKHVACRDHAYANGARGWWLVGWVNVIDYADGTTWHAPTGAALQSAIFEALPKAP